VARVARCGDGLVSGQALGGPAWIVDTSPRWGICDTALCFVRAIRVFGKEALYSLRFSLTVATAAIAGFSMEFRSSITARMQSDVAD